MINTQLPDSIFGRKVDGAMERVLRGESSKPDIPEQETQTNAPNLDGFIWIPSIKLYVAKERSLQNTNWRNAHKELIKQGLEMPTPRQTWDVIFYLQNRLNDSECKKLYDDILKKTPENTWHGEWQNAIFSQEGEQMYIQRVTGLEKNGDLKLSQKEPLETCLTQDGLADISSANITKQGLCKAIASGDYQQGKNIYFYYPRNGVVAWFDADSVGAYLGCLRVSDVLDPSLGVRAIRRAVAKNLERKKS